MFEITTQAHVTSVGWCLSASLDAKENERAEVTHCNWGRDTQYFDFVDGLIKSQTGLCLDVKGGKSIYNNFYWDGTAPSCEGECDYLIKNDNCGDGSCCWSGDKAYCSRSKYLPLIWHTCHNSFNQKFVLKDMWVGDDKILKWQFEGKQRDMGFDSFVSSHPTRDNVFNLAIQFDN